MKLTFALNTCTVLTNSEQMKRSNTTEALFSQGNQAAEAFFCITQANKKPYGFIDGPFIPQDTQSKKSEYIESA